MEDDAFVFLKIAVVANGQALEDRHQGEQVAVDVTAAAADQLQHVRQLRSSSRFCGFIKLLVVCRSAILMKPNSVVM